MPGYLSQMFDPADGGSDSQQGQQHLGLENGVDVQQELGVHTDLGISYEDANGTTHSYESSHDLTADVGLQATLGVAADTAEGLTSEGY